MAGTKAHPAVRSWLHAVRAHHHACLGNARTCQTDLTSAWTLLSRADDGEIPPYIGYLDTAEIGKWVGHAMIALGRITPTLLRTGRTAIQDARAAWPSEHVRGLAELLTVEARLHTACGDHDAAAELAAQAVTIASETGSVRNLRAALAAQAHLLSPDHVMARASTDEPSPPNHLPGQPHRSPGTESGP
jgi:hypothetical protein